MKICKSCKQIAKKEAKLFRERKTTICNSYDNLHALHELVWERRKSIEKGAKMLGVEVHIMPL